MNVVAGGVAIAIPCRIYHRPVPGIDGAELSPSGRVVLHCLYSRHGDGSTRQQDVEGVLERSEQWVVPLVVQLLGEYVIEIVEGHRCSLVSIADQPRLAAAHRLFLEESPASVHRTRQRAISSWSCYPRGRAFRRHEAYPGVVVLDRPAAPASVERDLRAPGAV